MVAGAIGLRGRSSVTVPSCRLLLLPNGCAGAGRPRPEAEASWAFSLRLDSAGPVWWLPEHLRPMAAAHACAAQEYRQHASRIRRGYQTQRRLIPVGPY